MPKEDTQFKSGKDWKGNAGGRPKGSMKNYLTTKFLEMSEEEKEKFLKKYKVSGKDMIEFAEGKARGDSETPSGEKVVFNILNYGDNITLQVPAKELPDSPAEITG